VISSRRTWLAGGAATLAVVALGRASLAQGAAKTYPLAARSLVLDVAQAGDALIGVGDRGFILRSTDMGQTWTQVVSPTEVMLTSLAMPSPTVGIAVGHDATILRSADSGATWAVKSSAPDLESPLLDVWFASENQGFAIGAYGLIYETRDGGETWTERRISEDEPHLYAFAKAADGSLFAAGEAGALFRSTDRGATWTAIAASPYEGSYFGLMSLIDGALLAFGLRGNLFRSPDLGKTWEEIPTETTASLMGGVQRKDGSIYIVGLSGTILTSIDGKSFQLTTLPEREALSGVFETAGQQMIVFGERGVRQLHLEQKP
jgi:photosystem II stability/assembly factor-like uncharacterized protein